MAAVCSIFGNFIGVGAPLGIYLARVLERERTWFDPLFRPIEKSIYKLCGVNSDHEMAWREYAFALLGFSAVSMLATYVMNECRAGRCCLLAG